MSWPNLYLELDVLTNDDRNWFWDFDDLFFSEFRRSSFRCCVLFLICDNIKIYLDFENG